MLNDYTRNMAASEIVRAVDTDPEPGLQKRGYPMKLQWKAKIVQGQTPDNLTLRDVVDMPKAWKRSHVVEPGKAAAYVNSNMLGLVVARELRRAGIPERIDITEPPHGVTVERHGPVATINLHI